MKCLEIIVCVHVHNLHPVCTTSKVGANLQILKDTVHVARNTPRMQISHINEAKTFMMSVNHHNQCSFSYVICSFFASIKGTFLKDSCNTKLRTYCKFKKTYTFENYLGVSVDKKIISQYSKLRLSSNRLNIEVGRYTRTPVNLRTCNICSSSDIEDEFRLMCVCSKFSDIRNNLFKAISKFVVNFDTLSLEENILMVLSSQQSDVNLLVVDYVNKCFEVRVMHQE